MASPHISADVLQHIEDIRTGRPAIWIVGLRLIGDGPLIIGEEDSGPPVPVRRKDLHHHPAGGRYHPSPLWFGGTHVRLATASERSLARTRARDPRPWHLWGSRWCPPAPVNPCELDAIMVARRDRAHSCERYYAQRRLATMTPSERRDMRDAARPNRAGARRRRAAGS